MASDGLQFLALGVLPVLLTALQFQALVHQHSLAVDFRSGPWVAGHSLFAGHSPYLAANSPQLTGINFVYPAVAALLLAPFSLLSQGAAGATFTLLNIAAILLTLRVLEVKDWRVYGACLLWPSVIAGWETANITLLLGLGIAVLWRYRAHPAVAGAMVALLISLKLFLWPVALWLIATKRYRALGHAVVFGLGMNLLAWGLLGFNQIIRYEKLIVALTHVEENRGYSLMALMLNRGVERPVAFAVMLGVSALAAVACIVVGRRGDSRLAFALCIATCLLVTPISWLHYFAVLAIPLALSRPRLSVLWLVPVLFQFPTVGPSTWQIVITLAVGVSITAVALLPAGRTRRQLYEADSSGVLVGT